MQNTQPPEPPVTGSGDTLDVHSIFLTIQGEGPYSGRRAVFVRLAGCNLQCPSCDTLYTEGRRSEAVKTIAYDVNRTWMGEGGYRLSASITPLVVITGGEPLRQPIGRLCQILLNHGYTVQIESNGTVGPDQLLNDMLADRQDVDLCDVNGYGAHELILVVSPKTRAIHPVSYERATAFKYVLDHRHVDPQDGLPTVALGHERGRGVARPRPGAAVYVTPMDETQPGMRAGTAETVLNMEAVARTCIRHGYIANVQLHKSLGIA